jgi:DNA polymerase III subunit delta
MAAKMDANGILSSIKKGDIRNLYFLEGEEPFFIDQISEAIEKYALPEHEKEFNQFIFYGQDIDIAAVISQARQFPMMAERQVIIIREAQECKNLIKPVSVRNKTNKTVEIVLLEEYVKSPMPSTVLVICYKHGRLDKRTKAAKNIIENSVYLNSEKLKDNNLPNWIESCAQSAGMVMNPDAAFMMSEFLGNDLSRIKNELEKLQLKVEKGKPVTREIVLENIGISKEYNVFELNKALGKRDILKAYQIINYFALNPKENPIQMITGGLYSYFQKMYALHVLAKHGDDMVSKRTRVPPYYLGEYKAAAKFYTLPKLAMVFDALSECDLKSKGVEGVTISEGELLKELVYKIIH